MIFEKCNNAVIELFDSVISGNPEPKEYYQKYIDFVCKNNLKTLRSNTPMLRVRKNSADHLNQPYAKDEIGMKKVSSNSNRYNNRYGNLFYLGNTSECCFAECDLKQGDRATVGHFITTQDLQIVSLVDGRLFDTKNIDLSFLMLYLVEKVLSKEAADDDQPVLYNLCQWIFDFVKANGALGVEYKSSKWRGGKWMCYAFIDDENIKWEQSDLIDILEADAINRSYKVKELDYLFC